MADATNFEEMNSFPVVWRALGRLYDSTVETREAVEGLRKGTDRLLTAVEKLSLAAQAQQQMLEQHERRLDRNEITTQAILEDIRRLLDDLRQRGNGRSPQ